MSKFIEEDYNQVELRLFKFLTKLPPRRLRRLLKWILSLKVELYIFPQDWALPLYLSLFDQGIAIQILCLSIAVHS